MRVLLDENLPHDLAIELPGHDVFTVQGLGWAGLKNGDLLRARRCFAGHWIAAEMAAAEPPVITPRRAGCRGR